MSIRIGLGRLRNQVSAVKKLQTPSRTTKTTTILVAFVVLNKLLAHGLQGGGLSVCRKVPARSTRNPWSTRIYHGFPEVPGGAERG